MLLEIIRYCFCLVIRDRIDVAESASGGVRWVCGVENCGFGVVDGIARVYFGGADARDVGASTGPSGIENVSFGTETACWPVGAAECWRVIWVLLVVIEIVNGKCLFTRNSGIA